MKICFVASTFPRSRADGRGRFIRSIAEALVEQGQQVHVVIPHTHGLQVTQDELPIHPFRYLLPERWELMGYGKSMDSDRSLHKWTYLIAPLYFIGEFFKILSLHRRVHFNLIHANWVIPNGPSAALFSLLTGVPLVISLHGSDIFVARNNRLLRTIARSCFKRAAAVTACSQELAEGAIACGAQPKAIQLVPWGADAALFDPSRVAPPAELRQRLGISESAAVILALGRLVEKKGIGTLLQALPAVQERFPKVHVVIAGNGPERARLEQLSSGSDCVHFTGAVTWQEVPQYLAMADIFCVPSIKDSQGNLDGLPTTILEAMAMGKAVVASNVGGIPLAVEDGGTGVLVPPGEPGALAEALGSLLGDPDRRARFGAGARQRVLEDLNWRSVAEHFINLYRDILSA